MNYEMNFQIPKPALSICISNLYKKKKKKKEKDIFVQMLIDKLSH